MAQAQPVEGRSAGKAPLAGRLRIGQIVSVGPHAKASIPSRFETVLNTGQRESDAFGRRTYRFDEAANELPGPGTYVRNKESSDVTPSVSKKGTGTFASGSRIATEQPRALFISPGPGAYQGGENARRPEPPSSSFAPPVPKRAIVIPPGNLKPQPPGPGDYELPAPAPRGGSIAQLSAVFQSKTQRGYVDTKSEVPGPGEYPGAQERLALSAPAAASAGPTGPGPHAVFRSVTNREGSSMHKKPPVNLDLGELAKTLPAAPVAGPELFKVNRAGSPRSPNKATELLRNEQRGGEEPASVADEILARKRKPKPSSVFAPTVLDRFGRPTVRYVPEDVDPPGPGQYHSQAEPQRMLISSSWALCGTSRFEPAVRERWKAPGPAFYSKPQEKVKQSYHMNSKNLWVS